MVWGVSNPMRDFAIGISILWNISTDFPQSLKRMSHKWLKNYN